MIDKSPDPDWAEVKAAVAAAVLKAQKGTFIYGQIAWKIFRDLAVNRDTLDQVAPTTRSSWKPLLAMHGS